MSFWSSLKKNKIMDLSAQLAFYFLFMLVPFIIFTLSLLRYLPLETKNALYVMTKYFPESSGNIVRSELKGVLEQHSHLLLVVLLSLFATTNGLHAIIRSLNTIHNIKETRSFWKIRGIAILFAVMMMIVIVIQLFIPVFGTVILLFVQKHGPDLVNYIPIFNVCKWIIGFAVVYIAIWCLNRFAPCQLPVSLSLHVGVFITASGWQLTSYLFSFYLAHFSQYNVTYGTLGALTILMAWFYAIGFFLLIGASVNAFLRRKSNGSASEVSSA